MDRLGLADIARRAGVGVDVVRSYVEAGVLTPDATGAYRSSDIARARLVSALVEAGVSLHAMAAAIADGRLSFRFVDLLMPDPVGLVPVSSAADDAAARDQEEAIQRILGTKRDAGDPIREDDLAILDVITRAVELGAPGDRAVSMVRSVGQAAKKITDLQRDFIDEVLLTPAIARTGSPIAALEATSETRYAYRELGRRLSALLLERFVDDAVFTNLVELTEQALAEGGVQAPALRETVVFVDVSGYTGLAEVHGDLVSAHQAGLLADFVQDLARVHGARLVKTLGDGAMVHATSAHVGLEVALEAVSRAETNGIWALHAGVNTGAMVRRDGDYYGAAVNIASRVADQAGPGEVVVTQAVVDAWTGDNVDFTAIGPVNLKHVAEPVALFRAARRQRQAPRHRDSESRA